MQYDELIQACIDALKQYNPDIEGPDSFFDIFISKVKYKLSILRFPKTLMKECLLDKFFMDVLDIKNFLKFLLMYFIIQEEGQLQ
jgi:hypothetical protein